MIRRFLVTAGLAACFISTPVWSAKEDPLNRFFHKVNTFNARFTQVVLDEALTPMQESSGTLWLERPGKFRWIYDKPFEQHIVGDGKQIWLYDVELRQVTVRPMSGALGYTPAVLLAGSGRLTDNFTVTRLGKQGKLEWMQMMPKKSDGGFESIRVGFEGNSIRMLEMVDSFGHTTRVTLRDTSENKKIDREHFKFIPPPGVDIVHQ